MSFLFFDADGMFLRRTLEGNSSISFFDTEFTCTLHFFFRFYIEDSKNRKAPNNIDGTAQFGWVPA